MFHLLFDAFSFWLWVTVAALFVIELFVAEAEKGGWGFLWLAIWFGAMTALTDFNPLPWIAAHWLLSVLFVIGYVLAGIVYALFRWALLIHDPAEYQASNYKFEKDKPKVLKPDWYRDRIVSWMMWWPPSLAWYLLRWPRKVFVAAFNALSTTFQRMADAAAAKIPTK